MVCIVGLHNKILVMVVELVVILSNRCNVSNVYSLVNVFSWIINDYIISRIGRLS